MNEFKTNQIFGAPLELGQSGATLTLVQSDLGNSYIIKRDQANPNRLMKQFIKQKLVKNAFSPFIFVPELLSDFSDDGFSMEFIHGQTLGQFLETSSRDELTSVLNQLVGFLGSKNDSDIKPLSMNPMAEKILAVKNSLLEPYFNPIFVELADTLISKANLIQAVSGITHGDFSFENLLIEEFTHKVFAIDFLDSPLDTRLIDYGRIWLDVRFGWWANWGKESTRYALNRSFMSKELTSELDSQNVSKFEVEYFCGVAIIRIAPYTKNPKRIAFLQHAARQLVRELNWN